MQEPRRNHVIVVGGAGGLSSKYRSVVEGKGMTLHHYEQKLPKGQKLSKGIALIVVFVGMVSHPLREQAQRLASSQGAPIVYVRSPSISALREVLVSALSG